MRCKSYRRIPFLVCLVCLTLIFIVPALHAQENYEAPGRYKFRSSLLGPAEFIEKQKGNWILKTVDGIVKRTYFADHRDDYYIYLVEVEFDHAVALPLPGAENHDGNIANWEHLWISEPDISRVGGYTVFALIE